MQKDEAPSFADLRLAVISALPEFAGSRFNLLDEGWDCVGLEADGAWIFKFPRRDAAIARLRREHRTLGFIRPRVDMPVPEMALFETPTLFSMHRKLPGQFLETKDYAPLSNAQRDTIAEKLAALYAQLHAVPVNEARAIGLGPIDPWMAPDEIVELARPRLPARILPALEPTIVSYAAIDARDDQVFGYFDGHGWNMAFDPDAGVLNGVYDFADSGLGARHQDLSYSNWISQDLTLRIIGRYERLTGHHIDRERVMLYSGALRFLELADTALDDPDMSKRLQALDNWFPFGWPPTRPGVA